MAPVGIEIKKNTNHTTLKASGDHISNFFSEPQLELIFLTLFKEAKKKAFTGNFLQNALKRGA